MGGGLGLIRVMIVDDQRLMRDGLKTLLSLEKDIEVVHVAANGEEAVQHVGTNPVDVVLMDIRMPVKNGIEATREIVTHHPQVKVLILTTFEEQSDVVDALSAGAVGYLLKDMPAEDIAAAIRTAHQGGAVLPPNIAKTFLSAVQHQGLPVERSYGERTADQNGEEGHQHSQSRSEVDVRPSTRMAPVAQPSPDAEVRELLTEREIDVLHCLAKGMSNREISEALYVTEGTVKNHVSNLIAKLNLRDRTQVALYAVRHGYGQS
jgi:DNA-binding NarL/FixJ family response regulator